MKRIPKGSLARWAMLAAVATPAWAGEIQSIDPINFGPLAPDTTVRTLYDRPYGDAGAVSYGEIGWDVVKAVDPGITVYNNVPPYAAKQIYADCVMAPRLASLAGDPDKKCNDGFQSHKRYKMNATAIGAIDLVFTAKNVENAVQIVDKTGAVVAQDNDPLRNVYRMIGKLNNHTGMRLSGFRVELGHGLGSEFVASTTGDGLQIVLRDDDPDPAATALGDNDMAEFPGGLFYDANAAGQPRDWGFFSSLRAGFTVDTSQFGAEQDRFESTTMFGEYESKFGQWLPIDWVPPGWFMDHDGDPATDAVLQAWYDGAKWLTYDIEPATGTRVELEVDAATLASYESTPATVWADDADPTTTSGGTLYATWDNAQGLWVLAAGGTVTNDELTVFLAEPAQAAFERRAGYVNGPVEDLANLNLNYLIEVRDIASWLGYDAATQTAQFTLRITPIAAADNTLPAWVPPPPAPAPTSDGDGSGCTLGSGGPFDPLLLTLVVGAAMALRRRRH